MQPFLGGGYMQHLYYMFAPKIYETGLAILRGCAII